jgi:hypothetical protein
MRMETKPSILKDDALDIPIRSTPADPSATDDNAVGDKGNFICPLPFIPIYWNADHTQLRGELAPTLTREFELLQEFSW